MTNRLMISVATLALVAGTGFANAQGTGMGREAPSAAPAQQSSPSSERGTTGQVNRDTKQPGMKSTQSEERSPGAAKNQRAEEGSKAKGQGNERADQAGQNRDKTVGQSTKSEGRENMKSEGREESERNAQRSDQKMNKESDKNAQRTDQKMNKENARRTDEKMKNENAQRTDEKMKNENAQRTDEKMRNENAQRTDQKTGHEAEGRSGARSQETIGQAGAGAKLSTEQRTKITTVIRDQHVAPVKDVNFSIAVGTRVPRDVSFHPLPAEVVSIYPEWRGYEFVLVRDQIVVIDPRTFEIVAILEA
jgi:hypothetical protein